MPCASPVPGATGEPQTFFTFGRPFATVAAMRKSCVTAGLLLRLARAGAAPRVLGLLISSAGALACEDPAPKSEAQAAAPAVPPGPKPEPALEAAKEPEKAEPKPVEKKAVVCPPAPKVGFSDEALEKEVRRKAAKPEGELSLADVRKVRSVDLTRSGAEIESLDPCVFPLLTNLRHLYIGRGSITDLTPLERLTKLEGLRISMNPVSDITPLAGMLQMDRLDLGHTQIRDLSPLKKMTNLTELMLDDTPIDDVTPLAGLTKLERLSLKRTRVSDISPLKSLRKLEFLYVGGAPVESSGGIARPGLTISSEQ
jgi:internalin A